ncbi:hypothetical protein MCOR25_005202 [Pyricularia grisea]|nr:hypothetical protein MCOR25_005202 [Pyricularia grisea]
MAGTASFGVEADGKISFDAAQGLKVHVDFISLGDESVIEHIYETEAFYERSVASLPDLLRLRARTIIGREGKGDILDFMWLSSTMTQSGKKASIPGKRRS